MKTRIVSGVVLSTIAAGALLGLVLQKRQASKLRQERVELGQELAARLHPASTAILPPETAVSAQATPLTPEEKLELMQLRNQVSTLRERQRELARVKEENARLRGELAGLTNNPGGLPPGYVRGKDMEYAGTATPEAAVQSFLWCIENRDTNRLVNLMIPEMRSQLVHELEQRGTEAFLGDLSRVFSQFRIISRAQTTPKSAEVLLEIAPGRTQTMKTLLIDGAWLLAM